MKHTAMFFVAMLSLDTLAVVMALSENTNMMLLADSPEITYESLKFLRSDDMAEALSKMTDEQVSDLLLTRDLSAFKNPPLLHLVANAKVKRAMILLDYVGNSERISDLLEADEQNFNNPLTMAIAKGSDYFDNKYKSNPVKTDDDMSVLIESLIKVCPCINWRNKDGNTALHFAFLRRDEKVVNDLLNAGADPMIQNNEGLYPEEMKFKSIRKANLLLEKQVGGIFFSKLEDSSSTLTAKRCKKNYIH